MLDDMGAKPDQGTAHLISLITLFSTIDRSERIGIGIEMLALSSAFAALLQPPAGLTRRGALAGVAGALAAPLAASANDPIGATGREGGALAATCLGFGW